MGSPYPLPIALPISIIRGRFRSQVDGKCEGVVIPRIREEFCNEGRGLRPTFVAVHATVNATRIHAGQEAGPTRRADRALTIGLGKGNPFSDKAIEIGSPDIRISQRLNSIVALLIGADPEDVWGVVSQCSLFPVDFYERTRDAFAVVMTGDTAKYGNILLRKGSPLVNAQGGTRTPTPRGT